MTVDGIGKQFSYDKPYSSPQAFKRQYDEEFAGKLGDKAGADREEVGRKNSRGMSAVTVNYRENRVVTEVGILDSGFVNINALIECGVRNISYAKSDHVKLCVTEGYTLKAKVDLSAHKVYIEQKNEDGTVHGYEVNPLKVDKNTKDPIEKMALESWELTRNELNKDGVFQEAEGNELTHGEALLAFYDFIEDRIKNGPPKIATGGAEFSVKDWDRLIENLDRYLEAVREELRQRLEKGDTQQSGETQKTASTDGDESLEEKVAELFKERDSMDSEIIVKPDGSRVLLLSLNFGGMESVLSLEISRETELPWERLDNIAKEYTKEDGEEKTENGNESEVEETVRTPRGRSFLDSLDNSKKKAPYSYLADESGMITYKGVTFYCDDERQSLCLGDTSDVDNTLVIPLSGGGCLKVNRANLGDLARAIGMFSPEDQGRIMRAISLDAKVRQTKMQIEEETSGTDIGEENQNT